MLWSIHFNINNCHLKYIGQTGRNFKTRYKEHIHAIRTNKTTSKYAQHILETGHTYGTIENTLNILHCEKKGPLMNTLEQFHIHRLAKDNLQLNDTYTDTQPYIQFHNHTIQITYQCTPPATHHYIPMPPPPFTSVPHLYTYPHYTAITKHTQASNLLYYR
jgi:hypothetical protein